MLCLLPPFCRFLVHVHVDSTCGLFFISLFMKVIVMVQIGGAVFLKCSELDALFIE